VVAAALPNLGQDCTAAATGVGLIQWSGVESLWSHRSQIDTAVLQHVLVFGCDQREIKPEVCG